MNKPTLLEVLLVTLLSIGNVEADESAVDVARIAALFRFPSSELMIENVSHEYRKIDGDDVLSSYQINSKTIFAFYPVLVAIAREGTFVTDEAKQILSKMDSAPEGSILKGGRGPLGSLFLGNGVSGGLLIGEIRVPPTRHPLDRPETRMAMFSVANIHAKKIDIRIAMLSAFPHAENLVKVPGGEMYYQDFADPTDDKNYAEPAPRPEFDVRGLFTALTELVRKSPLVANAKEIDNSTKATDRTASPPSTAPSGTSPLLPSAVAQTPVPTIERRAPVWPWLVGIAALIVIFAFVSKRRTWL